MMILNGELGKTNLSEVIFFICLTINQYKNSITIF